MLQKLIIGLINQSFLIELNTVYRQLKLYADVGKNYLTDVVEEIGIKKLGRILRSINNIKFKKWLDGSLDPIDEQKRQLLNCL